METTTGEIYENLSSSFDWKIKDFSSLSDEPGTFHASPPFDFYGATWCLRIYSNGYSNNCSGYISVFLRKLNNFESNNTILYRTGIKKSDGTDYISYEFKIEYDKSNISYGLHKFTERSELLKEIHNIAPDGILTISCSVSWNCCASQISHSTISDKSDVKVPEPPTLWKGLVRNMKDSFLKQKYCDVVIKVKGLEFPAHKMMLASRSPVFEAMFETDMLENRDNIVEINDSEPDIFRDFLLYLYCGKVEKMSSENVFELYALSDKYFMEDLKKECVKFMECNLSVGTVCDVLLVAEKYGEKQLNERAQSFALKNANTVLSSDQWKKFESESQLSAIQILKSIVLDKASKLN